MFTKHLTAASIRRDLTRIVERFGFDHTATNPDPNSGATCIYAVTDEKGNLVPVCIVGQLFASYGLLGLLVTSDPSQYANPSNEGACMVGSEVWTPLVNLGWTVDEDAREYAYAAQRAQDNGATWGDALKYADAMHVHRAAVAASEGIDYAAHPVTPQMPSAPEQPVEDEPLADWERELLADDSPF